MTFSEFLVKEDEGTANELRALLAGFSDLAPVNLVRVGPGQTVLRQGERRGDIYVLLSGQVLAVARQTPAAAYAFQEFHPIELFGEQEALAGSTHIEAEVRAKSACRFLTLRQGDYLRWVQSDVRILQKRVHSVLAVLFQQLSRERVALFLDSNQRFMLFLCNYYESHGAGGAITVGQSHAAIAEEMGCSLRTVNRAVQTLRQQGDIGVQRGKITVGPAQYTRLKEQIGRLKVNE